MRVSHNCILKNVTNSNTRSDYKGSENRRRMNDKRPTESKPEHDTQEVNRDNDMAEEDNDGTITWAFETIECSHVNTEPTTAGSKCNGLRDENLPVGDKITEAASRSDVGSRNDQGQENLTDTETPQRSSGCLEWNDGKSSTMPRYDDTKDDGTSESDDESAIEVRRASLLGPTTNAAVSIPNL